jgi:hypothetical protein
MAQCIQPCRVTPPYRYGIAHCIAIRYPAQRAAWCNSVKLPMDIANALGAQQQTMVSTQWRLIMSIARLSTVRRLSMAILLSMLVTLLTFASAPSASAHPGHSHQLRLISLYCYNANEDSIYSDGDEPYIKVGSLKVWSSSRVYAGSNRSLTNVPLQQFLNSTTVWLYEGDGDHWYDRDDLIGKVTVSAAMAGTGYRSVMLTGSGTVYKLTYQIL